MLAEGAVDLLPDRALELLHLRRRGRVARAVVRVGTHGVLTAMRWLASASRPTGR